MEIDDTEKLILQKMIFAESIENIIAESKNIVPTNIVTDIIKFLLHHKLIVAIPIENKGKPGYLFDSDKMNEFNYRITSRGLKKLGL